MRSITFLRLGLLGLLFCGLSTAGEAQSGKGKCWGYNGDGSGIVDAKPPTKFNEKTDIRWQVELPTYGHSQPIVVNGKVFVVCEPFTAELRWPKLFCFNADDGKKLWEANLNHLPAVAKLTDAQRTEADVLLKTWHEQKAIAGGLAARLNNKEDEAAVKKDIEAGGFIKAISAKGGKASVKSNLLPAWEKLTDKHSPFAVAGFSQDDWGGWGAGCIGEVFATPVTDGTAVFVATAWGGFFAFELDGTLRWVKHYPGIRGEYCRNGRSPMIYKDVLISDMTALVRAIDRKTGELRWSAPNGGETIETPVVAHMGDRDVLLTYDAAFLLPDGKPLKVDGWKDFGGTMRVKYDDPAVVFFTGGGEHGGWTGKGSCPTPPPAAVRFVLEGDTLKGTVLWSGTNGDPKQKPQSSHIGVLYFDGKLYHNGNILDAGTGKVVVGGDRRKPAVAEGGHTFLLANGHIYGFKSDDKYLGPNQELTSDKNMFLGVSTLDGKEVLTSKWSHRFNYSPGFALDGDRIYLRSRTHLACVAVK